MNRKIIATTVEPGIIKRYDTKTGTTRFCPKYNKMHLGSFSSIDEAREVRKYALNRLKRKNTTEEWKKRIDKLASG